MRSIKFSFRQLSLAKILNGKFANNLLNGKRKMINTSEGGF